jgi:diguanylate cyclase (GGDEF)-like protein
VQQIPAAAAPDPSKPRFGRLLGAYRWFQGRNRAAKNGSSFAFGARLLATGGVTVLAVTITAYVLLERNLAQRQINSYAVVQRSDARAIEKLAARAPSPRDAIHDADSLVDSAGTRPGAREAILVDSQRTIRSSLNDAQVGTRDSAQAIQAALEHGTPYSGHERDPGRNVGNFEFVVPLNVRGVRYAYEVEYGHHTYDAQRQEVRAILGLIGLLALIGGGGLFYVVGGRRLMRDHRMVLRRATRDGLTDLPNQRAFHDDFPRAVASAARYQEAFAVTLLDVDAFKRINDHYGHPHGDATLKRVADVLREARPGDRPYRVGGDEFALMLAHTDAEGAGIVAQRLSHKLAESGIEASIGVSALRAGQKADTLRAEADAALYEAKRQGGGRVAQFDEIRDRVFVTTSEKKEAVRRMIEEGRLTTVFQPIWDFDSETMLGVEALTRPDPSYELSGPAEAFDIAEQIGRVHQLDVLCVENALAFAPELEPGVLLFINVSPMTLDLDAEAGSWLAPAVARAGLRPRDVVIELTERFGGRTASVVKRLKALREQGFKIAVDDVGTGNSGLEILRSVQAEFVKLDRSIVATAATEPAARAVLMAMATFARQTGAFVIAEGIEDEEMLGFLRRVNERDPSSSAIIQGGQGYGLGRPSPELSPESPAMLHDSHKPRRLPVMDAGQSPLA